MPRRESRKRLLSRTGAWLALTGWVLGFLFCKVECSIKGRGCAVYSPLQVAQVEVNETPVAHRSACCSQRVTQDADTNPAPSHESSRVHCGCAFDPASSHPEAFGPASIPTAYLLAPASGDSGEYSGATLPAGHNYFRQAPWLEWMVTPELYLGPYVRSHAPPPSLV